MLGRGFTVVLATVALGISAAYAEHVHTTNGVYHGLGESANPDNYYVHPFTGLDQGNYGDLEFQLREGDHRAPNGYRVAADGECRGCEHVHQSYRTDPIPECHYYSRHGATQGRRGVILEDHPHKHHYWCGRL